MISKKTILFLCLASFYPAQNFLIKASQPVYFYNRNLTESYDNNGKRIVVAHENILIDAELRREFLENEITMLVIPEGLTCEIRIEDGGNFGTGLRVAGYVNFFGNATICDNDIVEIPGGGTIDCHGTMVYL